MNITTHVRRYHTSMDRSSLHTAQMFLNHQRADLEQALAELSHYKYPDVDEDRRLFQRPLDEVNECLALIDAALAKGEKHVSE